MNKTELKVKAAAWAAFAVSTVGVTLLQSWTPGWIEGLPLWLQAPAAGVVLAGVTWLAGWATRTRPANLSQSTIDAVQAWLRKRSGSAASPASTRSTPPQ